MIKGNRLMLSIYVTPKEKEKIDILIERISTSGKIKPMLSVIRKGILAVAEYPDLDILFDEKVCHNLTPEEICFRGKLYNQMEECITILENHGIELPQLEKSQELNDKNNQDR